MSERPSSRTERRERRRRERSLSKSTSRYNRKGEKRSWIGKHWFKVKRHVGQNQKDYLLGTLLALGASYAAYKYMSVPQLEKELKKWKGKGPRDGGSEHMAGVNLEERQDQHLATARREISTTHEGRRNQVEEAHKEAVTQELEADAAEAAATDLEAQLQQTGTVMTEEDKKKLGEAKAEAARLEREAREAREREERERLEREAEAARKRAAQVKKDGTKTGKEAEDIVREARYKANDERHEAVAAEIGARVVESDVLATAATDTSKLALQKAQMSASQLREEAERKAQAQQQEIVNAKKRKEETERKLREARQRQEKEEEEEARQKKEEAEERQKKKKESEGTKTTVVAPPATKKGKGQVNKGSTGKKVKKGNGAKKGKEGEGSKESGEAAKEEVARLEEQITQEGQRIKKAKKAKNDAADMAAMSDENLKEKANKDNDAAHETEVKHTQDHHTHVGHSFDHHNELVHEGRARHENANLRAKLEGLERELAQRETEWRRIDHYEKEMKLAEAKFAAKIPYYRQKYEDGESLGCYVEKYETDGPTRYGLCGWWKWCTHGSSFEDLVRDKYLRSKWEKYGLAEMLPTAKKYNLPVFKWIKDNYVADYDNSLRGYGLRQRVQRSYRKIKKEIKEVKALLSAGYS